MRNERDFAIVVGINTYDATSEFSELKGPTNDTRELIDWLKDAEGGAIPEENIAPYTLPSSTNPRADWSAITGALRTLYTRKRSADQPIGRRLYVFLAGHGFTDSITRSLLHSVETRRIAPAYVSGTQWLDCFHERALFDELVLWMDCCRDYEPNFDAPGRPCFGGQDAASNKVKRMYVLGTGFGKGSYERDFNGTVHGIFSRALVDALRDEAIDGEGRLTAANVYQVIADKLQAAERAGLNLLPEPTITPGFVLCENLRPRFTEFSLRSPDSSLKIEVFAGDDRNFNKPFQITRVANGALVFTLPCWKSYTAHATNKEGRLVLQMSFAVRNRDEPQVM
jgi:Caspase domain